MPLKVGTEIKHRLRQDVLCAKQKNEQQPANTSIPIEEWVNCLELVMDKRKPYNQRQCRWCVQLLFEIRETFHHILRRGGDKLCFIHRSTRGSNPVLATAKIAPCERPTAN